MALRNGRKHWFKNVQVLLVSGKFPFQGEKRLPTSASVVPPAVLVFSCGNSPLGGMSWIGGLCLFWWYVSGSASKQALDHFLLCFLLSSGYFILLRTHLSQPFFKSAFIFLPTSFVVTFVSVLPSSALSSALWEIIRTGGKRQRSDNDYV